MLTYLSVSNLGIIDKLELELSGGLTVITGETGAGKSMVLNALNIMFGSRVGRDMLRGGQQGLSVEGIWCGGGGILSDLLDGEELPEEVIFRRSVSFAGSSKRDRMYIAGRLVTASRVYEAASALLNISSQHEYVSLLRKGEHLSLLDRFAGLVADLEDMKGKFETFSTLASQLEEYQRRRDWREKRMEELAAIISELQGAAIREGEEEELLGNISRLSHAVEISTGLQEAILLLYEGESDLVSGLSRVASCLEAIAHFQPGVDSVVTRLKECSAELEDVTFQLRELLSKTEADPGLLDYLQERLSLLQRLKRKHGVGRCDELLAVLENAEAELTRLEEGELLLDDLTRRRDRALDAMRACARRLHEARIVAASKLEAAVKSMLGKLGMKKGKLRVEVLFDEESISATGGDDVEFLFSANPGEECKPLRKIASGGELSRLLLAFKAVLADAYPVQTYVFDEIDAGIGGRTALAVGKMLRGLAKNHQVICITHTAQIAAFADHHLVVTKEEENGRTFATIRELRSRAEKVEEIARMLSGLEKSASALAHARELLDACGCPDPPS